MDQTAAHIHLPMFLHDNESDLSYMAVLTIMDCFCYSAMNRYREYSISTGKWVGSWLWWFRRACLTWRTCHWSLWRGHCCSCIVTSIYVLDWLRPSKECATQMTHACCLCPKKLICFSISRSLNTSKSKMSHINAQWIVVQVCMTIYICGKIRECHWHHERISYRHRHDTWIAVKRYFSAARSSKSYNSRGYIGIIKEKVGQWDFSSLQ